MKKKTARNANTSKSLRVKSVIAVDPSCWRKNFREQPLDERTPTGSEKRKYIPTTFLTTVSFRKKKTSVHPTTHTGFRTQCRSSLCNKNNPLAFQTHDTTIKVLLFDAHNHLHFICGSGSGPSQVLQRSLEAGVNALACCATGSGPDEWNRALALQEEQTVTIHVSIGLHPWYVSNPPPDWKTELEHLLTSHPGCGIGEVGLDKSAKSTAPIEDQIRTLEWQLDLAQEHDLPVSLHCTGAWDIIYHILRNRPGLRHMLHGYHGSPEMTRELTRLGTWFSIGLSAVSHRRRPIGPIFDAIPQERLLIETDAPDGRLPGQSAPHTASEPADLTLVCDALARTAKLPASEIAAVTNRNARIFFRLPPDKGTP